MCETSTTMRRHKNQVPTNTKEKLVSRIFANAWSTQFLWKKTATNVEWEPKSSIYEQEQNREMVKTCLLAREHLQAGQSTNSWDISNTKRLKVCNVPKNIRKKGQAAGRGGHMKYVASEEAYSFNESS